MREVPSAKAKYQLRYDACHIYNPLTTDPESIYSTHIFQGNLQISPTLPAFSFLLLSKIGFDINGHFDSPE